MDELGYMLLYLHVGTLVLLGLVPLPPGEAVVKIVEGQTYEAAYLVDAEDEKA